MLVKMRHFASGFIAKLLVVLLIASFALWGVGDMVSGSSDPVVATVGDEEIRASEFDAEIKAVIQGYEIGGNSYTPEVIFQLNPPLMLLEEMVMRALLRQEIERLGLVPDESLALQEINQNPNFRNTNQQFDKTLFRQQLQRGGISESAYVKMVAQSLSAEFLVQLMTQIPLPTPQMMEAYYASQYAQKKVRVVLFDAAKQKLDNEPTTSDLQKYYDANKANYMAPEYRDITYIRLQPDQVMTRVDVSQKDVQYAYEQYITEEFQANTTREMRQLLYSSLVDAKKAHEMLVSGVSMDMVLKQHPPLNMNNINMSNVQENALPDDVARSIRTLREGEYSPPLETDFGWHVFQAVKVSDAVPPSFAQMEPELRKRLERSRAENTLIQLVEQVEDALASGQSLKEIATTTNLLLQNVEAIDSKGRYPDATVAFANGTDQSVTKALIAHAFTLPVDQHSGLQSAEDGSYYVVQVTNIEPPRQLSFDEIQGKLVAAWTKNRQLEQAKSMAELAADQFRAGLASSSSEKPDVVHEYDGATASAIVVMDRQSVRSGKQGVLAGVLTPQVIDSVFSEKNAMQPFAITLSKQQSALLVIPLEDLPAPSISDAKGQRLYEMYRNALASSMQNQILEAYIAALRQRYTVQYDHDAIDTVLKHYTSGR